MKTWKWTHAALSLAAVGLMTMGVGCEDKPAVTPGNAPVPTAPTNPPPGLPPAQPEAGSGISGGVEVPPPIVTDKPAEAADAPKNPEEIKKDEAAAPVETKPAE